MEKSRVEPIKSKGIIPFVRNANDYQSWKRFEIATTYIRSKESVKGHRHPLVNLFSQRGMLGKCCNASIVISGKSSYRDIVGV